MRILITGGTGFIGGHLVQALRKRHELVLLVNQKKRSEDNITYIKHDLTQPLKIKSGKIDCIIHLAQGNQTFPDGAITEFKVNTVSTLELLEFGRKNKIKRFIYASTGGVYGLGAKIYREQDALHSKNFYEGTKIAAESLIWQYRQFFNCIIVRLCFPYGPGVPPQRLFSRLIKNVKEGKEIIIKNEGNPYINPLYIDDLIFAFQRLKKFKESVILNLGGTEVYSIKEIVEKIGQILGNEPKMKSVRELPFHQNLVCDINLAQSLIDFNPTVSLDEGLRLMIEAKQEKQL